MWPHDGARETASMSAAEAHGDLHVVGEASRPLRLVLLHGHAGSPESLLEAAVALSDAAPVQVVLPRGPLVAGEGWAWWEVGSDCAPEVRAGVADLVGADPRPTVLAGFSQGGAMALLVAARSGAAPVGLVVVAGYVPDELASRPAADAPLPPVLVLHGEGDDAVDPLHGRQVARWVERAGAQVVTSTTYDAGHDWAPETTLALVDWLGALPIPGP
jgi:phospholipase/carboxylesterase